MRALATASLLLCAACSRASSSSSIQPEPSAGAMARPMPEPSAQKPPPPPAPSSSAEQVPPCAPETLRRGLALVLEQARKATLTEAQLDGCASVPLRCGSPPLDPAPGPCRIQIASEPDLTRFSLLLPPHDGAPLRLEVWMDPQANQVSRVFRDASTWASLPESSLLLRGETSHAIHNHGGEPASIGTVQFRAYNQGKAPRKLRLEGATWNTNYGNPIPLENVHFYREAAGQTSEIELSPGETALVLSFAPRTAYQSWGNQFFVEARLSVDGHTLAPRSEVRVTRVEPLRPRH